MVSATGSYDPRNRSSSRAASRRRQGLLDRLGLRRQGCPGPERRRGPPQTWIPVARGWVADPADAVAPPSGTIELTGRLLPSEAPLREHRSRGRPRQRRLGRRTHQRLGRQQLPGLRRRHVRSRRRHRRRRRGRPPATVKPLRHRSPAARAAGQLAEPVLFRGMGGLRRFRAVHLVAAGEGRLPPRPRGRARRAKRPAKSPPTDRQAARHRHTAAHRSHPTAPNPQTRECNHDRAPARHPAAVHQRHGESRARSAASAAPRPRSGPP